MKRLAQRIGIVAFVLAATLGASALVASTPAHAGSCPRNSHLIVCPDGHSFCCPNNAFCVCFP